MPIVSVRIPQIGEGLQEARLVAMLKKPGDQVKRDEPIYQMETDKAVMDVESPYEGRLTEWLAAVDAILPIGGEVARMEVGEGVRQMEVHSGVGPAKESEANERERLASSSRNASIPPRTRAYAKEMGIADDVLASIPAQSGKLMPSDVDAFLKGDVRAASRETDAAQRYSEAPVNPKQRVLSSRLVRGSQLVVPGTITVVANWEAVEFSRARYKSSGGDFQPSAFTMFAYCVAQALKDFPIFRSTLRGEDVLRTYDHAALGVAVALPGDELVLAVVEDADALSWEEFARSARAKIAEARQGKDQANDAVTMSLTNMQSFGLRDAVPVVVPPAVGTIFLGEVYNALDPSSSEIIMKRVVNIVLTFDHRVLNGVGAANFANVVKDNVERVSSLIS